MTKRSLTSKVISNVLIWSVAGGLANKAYTMIEERASDNTPSQIYQEPRRQERHSESKKQELPAYESSLREDIKRHEGVRFFSYDDHLGNRTVGTGFNMERKDARGLLEKLGADFDSIYSGREKLTEQQMEGLLDINLNEAKDAARKYLGSETYRTIDPQARDIVINMAFNMGSDRLSKFKNLQAALQHKDYTRAAEEMEDSKWYHQVGNRSKELVRKMRGISHDDN